LLILGLDAENMRRLTDEPIWKRLDGKVDTLVPGLEEWDLMILGPDHVEEFKAKVAAGEFVLGEPPVAP
jgi:hypothetical protein